MSEYDVVIVGAGVAGLTAARQVAEGGARALVLDRLGVGGQVSSVENLTNAPGFDEAIAGYDVGVELLEAAEAAGAEIMLAEVSGIADDGDGFVLTGIDEPLRARAVIVASGSERRSLGISGEQEFEGRGVSRCASCDGPFFRDRRVVVVGGGDSAFDEARVLADFADEVLVVHTGAEPTARAEISEPTLARQNVRVQAFATVSAISGDGAVSAVSIQDARTGDATEVEASGVFVYIGLRPNTEWLGGAVELDDEARVVVDGDLAASREGVFAAGDVRSGTAAMLAESAADGERAARSALRHLDRMHPVETGAAS